ncbi:NTP_transf_2 domain-containing protein [Cephalotus follicularis]|uniref:NTP_transf_2 domain-containing protein n=1 Tax=Cephalotus follicularis TaxID=3775 RepID=A0A1Q3BDY4_CEPFO|nr:NTP_transf_2 domain-containing protein [Cephalotus follicularis]
MGPQPIGFFPNGLLPNEAASVTRVLDRERWSQAEARTAELLACIQPSQTSEERRNAVARYVQHLIMKCFSCQVFAFGSVPLKTYLPDGDIDLIAFSTNKKLKDTWANEVRYVLESEEMREDAEFRVKEVQYIQAEVKIIKCLVENIVVDVSFNQLGGLCTLCFLEEVDQLINQNHLFKRSIILIKAWCYYESRILGAHHGLISTYALETLVLYIFHVFNCSFSGPLEVLYRFLEFFSKFDWDNFCVSLWGPVPINSLPDISADSPRNDDKELLLSKLFLQVCRSTYAVLPGSQENQEHPFVSKHFNIVDPLRINNNLGRSVNKGNFFRIRSAFAFGAQRLGRLLDCPKENIIDEVNQFFTITWDRHGKGHRLDAPNPDLYGFRLVNLDQIEGSDSLRNYSSCNMLKEDPNGHKSEVEVTSASHASHGVSLEHGNQSMGRMPRTGNMSSVPRTQVQKDHANLSNSMSSDQNPEILQDINCNEITNTAKGRSTRSDYMKNQVYARYQFARTHSSPQLRTTSTEILSRGRHNRASETGKGQTAPALSDNCRRNLGHEVLDNNSAISSTIELPSPRQNPCDWSIDSALDSDGAPNRYYGDCRVGAMGEDCQSVDETMQMHQEEHDFVNMMESSGYNFNGQVHMPYNLSSAYPPFPIPPTILASLGNAKSLADMLPTNVPSFESSWGSNMHNIQGLVPFKNSPSIRDKQGKKSARLTDRSVVYELDENDLQYEDESVDHVSSLADDIGEWIPLSKLATDPTESTVSGSGTSSRVQTHQIPGYEPAQISGSSSIPLVAQVLAGPESQPKANENHEMLPFAFYPTGPPVPFLTMIPVYNIPTEGGIPGVSENYFDRDEGFNECQKGLLDQSVDLTENFGQSVILKSSDSLKGGAFVESSEEHKSDILNGDIASHLQNLQYGRLCQNPQQRMPLPYPSSVVPPLYLQGHHPVDVPVRPPALNVNPTQFTSYSHCIPVSPMQPGSSRSTVVYQHYANAIPRYRVGTGTFLPNPMYFRDRQYSNARNYREHYSYGRKDHHGNREGSWNHNSKSRFAGRGQGRNQFENASMRTNRVTANNSRSDKPWDSFKHETLPAYYSHIGSSSLSNYMNKGYTASGMYPLPLVNSNGVFPTGTSVDMLYPYDQNMGYGLSAEQLGSLGLVHFSGIDEATHRSEEKLRAINQQWDFQGDSAHSSPDQPSSPQFKDHRNTS